jgi:hypothetical protein
MIFRWTIWGEKEKSIELLKYSILSFRKFFGDEHRYVVFTDNKNDLNSINNICNVSEFKQDDLFNIDSQATWKKWCPTPRVDINEHEVYVDSDVFLVNNPDEIYDFLENDKYRFAILDEFKGQSWQHGAMSKKDNEDTPFVNAGLFIQKAGYDITSDLLLEFDWWNKNIKEEDAKHHDEQGALAVALTKYSLNKELYILPKDKYALIGENENTGVKSLEDIKLFHAVYPTHPAFYKFRENLNKIIYE